jgi:hypothetical protein
VFVAGWDELPTHAGAQILNIRLGYCPAGTLLGHGLLLPSLAIATIRRVDVRRMVAYTDHEMVTAYLRLREQSVLQNGRSRCAKDLRATADSAIA